MNGRKVEYEPLRYIRGEEGPWHHGRWPVFAKRIGDEVYAPVRGAASWLDGKVTALPGGSVRLARRGKWVEVKAGTRVMLTPSGNVMLGKAPTVKDGCTVCALKPIVAALGGKSWFDAKKGRMIVRLK